MKLRNLIEDFDPQQNHKYAPYIIAEAGVNHECDLDLAFRLIDEAREGGAQAIKFQTYKAEKLASKNSPSYWDLESESTDSQFKLFSKYDKFGPKEFAKMKQRCDDVGIEFLSTPFDVDSADYLSDMMDVIKISSSDMNNLPFVRHLASYGKPILISTGASYSWEIHQTIGWIRSQDVAVGLMHCVLKYPTPDAQANLLMIEDLREQFPQLLVGYSDHTLPKDMKTLETAYLLGAVVLEKHFTHDKTLPGNDHYHAMDGKDLKLFWDNIARLRELLGEKTKRPLDTESVSRVNARRSLVAAMAISAGEVISHKHITWKRPGFGVDPRDFDSLVGKKALRDIDEDEVLNWNMFE